MNLSKEGYNLIVGFEGKKNNSYLDVAKIATIGVGFITVGGHKVTLGMSMTDEQIEKEFFKQILTYEKCVNDNVTTKLSQNQFDSLVSLVFNIGCQAFKNSTVLKLVNKDLKDRDRITAAFQLWCKAAGKTIPGLLIRRTKEANYFFKQ